MNKNNLYIQIGKCVYFFKIKFFLFFFNYANILLNDKYFGKISKFFFMKIINL